MADNKKTEDQQKPTEDTSDFGRGEAGGQSSDIDPDDTGMGEMEEDDEDLGVL